MTQLFAEDGVVMPVTAINIPKNIITQVKTRESDGYEAIQVAAGEQKEHRLPNSLKKHLNGTYRYVKEFRVNNASEYKVGDEILIDIFQEGDNIEITSISKGKGFQGGVKRWGFAGGRRSHGNKHAEREVGSIGAGTTPGKVWKGKKMPGRMGSDKKTIRGLVIVKVDRDNSRVFVGGSIAGKPNTIVEISKISI